MNVGDLVYHTASLKNGEKDVGIIIERDCANALLAENAKVGDMWYYKVKWLDTGSASWYDMEEVERVDARR
jgi:hypothetical protein